MQSPQMVHTAPLCCFIKDLHFTIGGGNMSSADKIPLKKPNSSGLETSDLSIST